MNIYDAMRAIVQVQESISIASPVSMKVQKAYLTTPPQTISPGMFPYWTNSWDFVRMDMPSNSLRRMSYLVEMRLHVGRATEGDNSKTAEIATAFLDSVLTAFGAVNSDGIGGLLLKGNINGTISPTVAYSTIRGGAPTLAVMDDGNRTIGLQLVAELEMADAFANS